MTPGDEIRSDENSITGHGVMSVEGDFISTVHGVVETINKLVCVKPIRSRYAGDIGDVVVGRIVSVLENAWKVDINGKNNAILQLSSVYLPDGIQRRRTQTDSDNIKTFFNVNDLLWFVMD